MEDLRASVVYMLCLLFKDAKLAEQFEEDTFLILGPKYVKEVHKLYDLLLTQDGYFPHDLLLNKYRHNLITVEYVLNYSKELSIRDSTTSMFSTLLYNSVEYFRQNTQQALTIAKTIENSCYNYVLNVCNQFNEYQNKDWKCNVFNPNYIDKCGSIYNLINPNSLTCKLYGSLLSKIINNDIDLENIANISEKQLCKKAFEQEINIIEKRLQQKIEYKESNLFNCPKCKLSKVRYTEVQTRAADEPPTYICVCLECGANFRA